MCPCCHYNATYLHKFSSNICIIVNTHVCQKQVKKTTTNLTKL